jgi:hypothetical protein
MHSAGSAAEDPIIEEMARLWWDLDDDERDALDAEGPTCWPEPDALPRVLVVRLASALLDPPGDLNTDLLGVPLELEPRRQVSEPLVVQNWSVSCDHR